MGAKMLEVLETRVEECVKELLDKKNVEKTVEENARKLAFTYQSDIKKMLKAGCTVDEICLAMNRAGVILDSFYVREIEWRLEILSFLKLFSVSIVISFCVVLLFLSRLK
jgi:hypothetical protein